MWRRILFLTAMVMGGALLLVACASPTPVVQEVEVTREVPREVEVTRLVEVTPEGGVPFEVLWAASAHADRTAEAFIHWNTEDPAEVPTACAKCHSSSGFQDFVGADGSPAGVVDQAGLIEDVIDCQTCHNPEAVTLSTVAFPSGVELSGLGPEARCMTCHQGRASGESVDAAIENAGLSDDDTPSADLGFTNIHYFAAAVSQFGTQVRGGYQYAGQPYDVKTDHVPGFDTCTGCHDPHSLEVKVEQCTACHPGVASPDDLKDIRMQSSLVDYDGDGDTAEGVFYEIEGVREKLYTAIQAYAEDVAGAPIVYEADSYPYFFIDTNGDGQASADEAAFPNRYSSWTGRLARAAYNYQTSLKDPGAYAHGGKYILQLLHDSLADLNTQLAQPVDMNGMVRNDAGHFAGSEAAFRHWDEDVLVPGACAKCHSGTGLPTFLANNTNVAVAPVNGLLCETCHSDVASFARFTVDQVRFPSGAMVSFGEADESNLCINCHQGRESTTSVNAAIDGLPPDEVSENLRFRNVHYFAAGATLFGTQARGAYEYAGRTYVGQNEHGGFGPATCLECHDTHALSVEAAECAECHDNAGSTEDLRAIRASEVDYDGDGDVAEGLADEISTMQSALYAALQAYAAGTVQAPLVYDSHAYPYFFGDTNANGMAEPEEISRANAFAGWTPRLLQAAYNYQYSQKDPGGYVHNGVYLLQVLYDSLEDIGGDVSGMTRP